MLLQFQKFVKEKKLFSKEQTILVAVSGGIDSMVLLQLLQQSGYKIAVAHCNFKLRGQESDDDAQFVHSFCQENKIMIHATEFETEKLAEQYQKSIQVTARELRYNFFQELCSRCHYDFIATAHQADDVAETILINLSRGGGRAAWHGIEVKRENIVRP
ncbi:MAG TPA: tRNA lysidine(34) synthetase TilS, partial [Bacteroidia bacterium]|nr:tRNA lysidine(34) synthetase TilS [Bacteroidia bacterium]